MEKPATVQRAIVFLWAAMAISGLSALIALAGEDMTWLLVTMAVIYAINAYVIHKASERANWARWLIGVVVVISVVLTVYPWDSEVYSSAFEWLEWALVAGLELVAVYWLFTGEGTKWYRDAHLA